MKARKLCFRTNVGKTAFLGWEFLPSKPSECKMLEINMDKKVPLFKELCPQALGSGGVAL